MTLEEETICEKLAGVVVGWVRPADTYLRSKPAGVCDVSVVTYLEQS